MRRRDLIVFSFNRTEPAKVRKVGMEQTTGRSMEVSESDLGKDFVLMRCFAVIGKGISIKKVPEIPVVESTCEIGYHCYYEARM